MLPCHTEDFLESWCEGEETGGREDEAVDGRHQEITIDGESRK